MTALADIAPRLARAHRERAAELYRERRAERHRLNMLARAERLVAHRELQLVRAYHTDDRRYILKRERKLDAARAELARWKETS